MLYFNRKIFTLIINIILTRIFIFDLTASREKYKADIKIALFSGNGKEHDNEKITVNYFNITDSYNRL